MHFVIGDGERKAGLKAKKREKRISKKAKKQEPTKRQKYEEEQEFNDIERPPSASARADEGRDGDIVEQESGGDSERGGGAAGVCITGASCIRTWRSAQWCGRMFVWR